MTTLTPRRDPAGWADDPLTQALSDIDWTALAIRVGSWLAGWATLAAIGLWGWHQLLARIGGLGL